MNRILIYILLVLLQFSIANSNQKISAKTAILMDYNSNEILFELDSELSIYPASMTKIMTTIVVFDLLQNKKISMQDEFIVSKKAWRLSQSGYSSMFIMVNDTVTVEDLLKGIIIVSGNDACVAIAEGIAGTEENFVEIMNEKAQEIGMYNTNFANSSGINNPDNYSTVKDIALMTQYLIKNYPEYYEMYAEKEFTWDRTGGDPIKQLNRNGLLFKNLGVDGVKTGYLAVEKYSLASSMKKDTRRLIAVGSGFETNAARTAHSIKLLSWGIRNTDTYEISKSLNTKFDVRTWLGKKEFVQGTTQEDVYITLSKKDSRFLKVSIDYNGPIKAPIRKGDQIAKLNIFKKDELIKEVPVFADENVEKVNFLKSLFLSLNYLVWGDV